MNVNAYHCSIKLVLAAGPLFMNAFDEFEIAIFKKNKPSFARTLPPILRIAMV